MSYDKYHENADRLYRVALKLHAPNEPTSNFAVTSPPLAEPLESENPGIVQVVRFTKEQVVITPIRDNELRQRTELIRQEFKKSPAVMSVSASSRVREELSTIL